MIYHRLLCQVYLPLVPRLPREAPSSQLCCFTHPLPRPHHYQTDARATNPLLHRASKIDALPPITVAQAFLPEPCAETGAAPPRSDAQTSSPAACTMTGVMKPNSDCSAAQMINLRSECTFVRIDHPPRDNRASDPTGIIPLNMKTQSTRDRNCYSGIATLLLFVLLTRGW